MNLTEQQDKVRSLEGRVEAYRRAMNEDEDRTDRSPLDRWWDRFPWGVTILFAIVVAVALRDSNLIVAVSGVLATVIAAVWSERAGKREKSRWYVRRAQFLDAVHDLAVEQRDFDMNVRAALRQRYGVTLPSRAVNAKTYTVQTPQGAARIWYDAGAPGRLLLGGVELPRLADDGDVSAELRRAHKIADAARAHSFLFAPTERVAIIALDDEVQRLRGVVNGTQRPEEKA